MTRLYLIRHAEAEGNLYRIAQGQCNSIITDRGLRQIEALRRRFESVPIDAVYSSDLYRTCVTAGAVYLPKQLPLHTRKDLREICVGEWEEKGWGELTRDYPREMMDFSKHLERWSVPGAETTQQVRDRVLGALRDIARRNDGKTAAVFCHGCAIRIALATLQGYPIERIGETPHGDNTSVSLLEADGETLRVVYRDDNSHLQNGQSTFGRQVWWKSPNALEPGLCFSKLRLPGQAEWLREFVRRTWTDGRPACPLDEERLIRDAAERPTYAAELEGCPVGLLQLHPDKDAERGIGWLSLYAMEPEFRSRGYGVQLLGQAVRYYRPRKRNMLSIALSEENAPALRFFAEYGFRPSGTHTPDGRTVFQKDIAFHPIPGKVMVD